MRISDWSSDVCSSDLPSAKDSEAGQHDDGTAFAGHDPVEQLQSVNVRHLYVQRNDIGIGNGNKVLGTFRIGCDADDVHTAVTLQHNFDHGADRDEILHYQRSEEQTSELHAIMPRSKALLGLQK